MSLLILAHEGTGCSGLEWLDGPSDVTVMATFNLDGSYAEPVLTDGGEPEVLHSIELKKWNDSTRNNDVIGHAKLIRFKGVRYVITRKIMRIDRNLKVVDVLDNWMKLQGSAPAPEAPPAE